MGETHLEWISPREYRDQWHVCDGNEGANDPSPEVQAPEPVLLRAARVDEEQPEAELYSHPYMVSVGLMRRRGGEQAHAPSRWVTLARRVQLNQPCWNDGGDGGLQFEAPADGEHEVERQDRVLVRLGPHLPRRRDDWWG